MAAVLEISEKDPLSTLNYLANIHENKDFNFHVLKWNNCVVLRNCNKKGELIQLNYDSIPWILLTLKPFKFKNIVYPIFSCSQCSPNILKMSIEHDPADFGSILCAHSKVATSLDTGVLNSQGRERIHSILDKCYSSLSQTNYFNFMRYMRVFFCHQKFKIH